MAVVHQTTLVPSKLELLTAWLPSQPWYRGSALPELSRAGGFRLDDPAGAVGIELMVINDASGVVPTSYLTPLTYRDSPLPGGENHLVGTTMHGVLGHRWVYDGPHDPVLIAQVLAFLLGEVDAQAQSESNTIDPTVSRELSVVGEFATTDALQVVSDGEGTAVRGLVLGSLSVELEFARVLPASGETRAETIGEVVANWTAGDGGARRGPFVAVVRA
ncbi:MAG: hypothetical protein WCA31_10215 [Acidimicrobiales bacterium]